MAIRILPVSTPDDEIEAPAEDKLSSTTSVNNQFSLKIGNGNPKMTYNCPQLSSKTGTLVPNQIRSGSSISSCSVLKKPNGKMTLFNNGSPILKKHRKMPDNLNSRGIYDLPKELLAEILKRLPVKYILRCRCVQRSWHSLIQSPTFITYHFDYQKENIITTTTASHHHYKYLFSGISFLYN